MPSLLIPPRVFFSFPLSRSLSKGAFFPSPDVSICYSSPFQRVSFPAVAHFLFFHGNRFALRFLDSSVLWNLLSGLASFRSFSVAELSFSPPSQIVVFELSSLPLPRHPRLGFFFLANACVPHHPLPPLEPSFFLPFFGTASPSPPSSIVDLTFS